MTGLIVGLSGKKQSGKDTVAVYLSEHYGFIQFAFADVLKRVASEAISRFYNDGFSTPWDYLDKESQRPFLQDLGLAIREIAPNFWIFGVEQEMAHYRACERAVISDVRFKNEAEWVVSRGGVLWRVERFDLESLDQHPSETELDDWPFSRTLHNSGLDDLYRQIDQAVVDDLAIEEMSRW